MAIKCALHFVFEKFKTVDYNLIWNCGTLSVALNVIQFDIWECGKSKTTNYCMLWNILIEACTSLECAMKLLYYVRIPNIG